MVYHYEGRGLESFLDHRITRGWGKIRDLFHILSDSESEMFSVIPFLAMQISEVENSTDSPL